MFPFREIYVPHSVEQQCDQHYVILQASRYLITEMLSVTFRKGCADEARSVAGAGEKKKKEKKKRKMF